MDAIKILLIVCCVPLFMNAQKTKFPKDTIYLLYSDTIFLNIKMKAKSPHIFKGKEGVKFWWEGKWVFYNNNFKPDTVAISRFKDFEISRLIDLKVKYNCWINKKFESKTL